MNKDFQVIQPEAITDNPFKLIDKDWMLITAGNAENNRTFNTMTASWGGLGILWHRRVSFCYVLEKNDHYTLSFFSEEYRAALNICGTVSGRDADKVARTGLPAFDPAPKTVSFKEARLILVCKKLYFQDLDPCHFLDPALEDNYPQKDYHRMYIGEITTAFSK